MSELVTVTLRIPKDLVKELDARVEPRYRSEYIRQAIIEKLRGRSSTSPMDTSIEQINELKARVSALEESFRNLDREGHNVQVPALLEVIALDETDRKIIKYIIENESATTKELEKVVNLRRRMILERTKAIEDRYEEKFGKPFLSFVRGKKNGKRQAWWIADS